jgi:hypothetical protein
MHYDGRPDDVETAQKDADGDDVHVSVAQKQARRGPPRPQEAFARKKLFCERIALSHVSLPFGITVGIAL